MPALHRRGVKGAMSGLRIRTGVYAGLLLFLLGGCLCSMAQASDNVKLTVAFSPDKLGAGTSIRTHISFSNSAGGLPSPVTGFDLSLPSQLELASSTLGLAVCQPEALAAVGPSGCSPNARLGSGSATVAVPFGPEVVFETARMEVLMGPPVEQQMGVLLLAESATPVSAQLVFPGKVVVGGGSETFATTFPPVPTLPGAADATAIDMALTVGPENLTYYKRVHGRQVAFHPTGISLPPKCPSGGFKFVTDIRFLDGTALTVPYTVPCPPVHHSPPVHRRRA
jgi:hypothetical protein